MANLLPSATLALLGVLGFYGLHIVGDANGLFSTITTYAADRLLPDNTTSWPLWFTPPAAVPIPHTLLTFFWPCVEPQNPAIALSGLIFVGQAVAGMTAVIVEGYRAGNRSKLPSYSTTYAQIMQFVGFGVVAPLFLLPSLFTGVTQPDPSVLAVNDVASLRVLPLSLLTGLVVPTVAMGLSYPGVLSLDAKVIAIMAWQIFPILVYLSGLVWKAVLGSPTAVSSARHSVARQQLGYLRFTYAFALVVSAIVHVAVVTLSVSAVIAPNMFTAVTAQVISPGMLFVPNLSPATKQVEDIAAGALNFLQWDFAVGSLAHLVWAIAITAPTRNARNAVKSDFSLGNIVVDVVVRSVLLGPLATTLMLIWERDEAVLGSAVTKQA